jgi:hypothetical protein
MQKNKYACQMSKSPNFQKLEEEMFLFFHLPVLFLGESICGLVFLTGTHPSSIRKIQRNI